MPFDFFSHSSSRKCVHLSQPHHHPFASNNKPPLFLNHPHSFSANVHHRYLHRKLLKQSFASLLLCPFHHDRSSSNVSQLRQRVHVSNLLLFHPKIPSISLFSNAGDIIIERWVPYGAASKRKTIVQRAAGAKEYAKPRNVIIQYEAAQVRVVRQFQRLGVTQENPQAYLQRYGAQLLEASTLVQQARAAGVVEDIVRKRIDYLLNLLNHSSLVDVFSRPQLVAQVLAHLRPHSAKKLHSVVLCCWCRRSSIRWSQWRRLRRCLVIILKQLRRLTSWWSRYVVSIDTFSFDLNVSLSLSASRWLRRCWIRRWLRWR